MSYVLFVSVLAFIAFRRGEERNAPRLFPSFSVLLRVFPIVIAVTIVTVWGTAWFVNAKPLATNRALLQALAPHPEGISKNLEYFNKALSYGFSMQEVNEQILQVAIQIAQVEQVPLEVKQEFLNAAVRGMNFQAEKSPLDPRFPYFLGRLLNTYGLYDEAKVVLEHARELSPRKQSILYELGSTEFVLGNVDEALAIFKEAYDLASENREARVVYAVVAIRAERDALANELVASEMQKGGPPDPRVVSAYVNRGQYDKLIVLYNVYLETNPKDISARFSLAAAYYAVGNSGKAISQLQKAAEIDPGVRAQAESMIEEIRKGTAPR